MTQQELEKLYIHTKHDIFEPIYTCSERKAIYDKFDIVVDYELVGYMESMTAQEHYEGWLADKNKPSVEESNKTQIQLNQQEQAIGVLATQVAKITLLNNQGGIK